MTIQLRDPIPMQPGDPMADQYVDGWLKELYQTLNHASLVQREGAIQHLDKAGNLDAKWLVFTSNGGANTEDTILHGLGRIPKGYWVAGQDKAASLYHGAADTAWTTTAFYCKSSAASVAWLVLVF